MNTNITVLARDSIYMQSAVYANPVCLSVCKSHWWISQKRLKLGITPYRPSPIPLHRVSQKRRHYSLVHIFAKY